MVQQLLSKNKSDIHLGPTCTAHPRHRPSHARATRRVGRRGNDLHCGDEGRRGTSAWHQESRHGNFWSAFELVRGAAIRGKCPVSTGTDHGKPPGQLERATGSVRVRTIDHGQTSPSVGRADRPHRQLCDRK